MKFSKNGKRVISAYPTESKVDIWDFYTQKHFSKINMIKIEGE